MDLAQFVSMLQRKQSFFVKASKLRDPYEGTLPSNSNLSQRSADLSSRDEFEGKEQYIHFNKSMLDALRRRFQIYREIVLMNSWHYNEYESAAMWQLYSQENAGIAIQSTTSRLSRCFESNKEDVIWIGKVDYLDYSREWLSEWSAFKAFVIKRKSFEYENEVRAVTCLSRENDEVSTTPSYRALDYLDDLQSEPRGRDGEGRLVPSKDMRPIDQQDLTDKGKYVTADLQTLVENIYIAPFSEPWFKDVVQSLLSKYELQANVIRSDLYTVY
jgi:hypothetical protein